MTSPADPISARFAEIQANREAASSATRASAEESRKKTDAAGAAVHAKARGRLSTLSRRAAGRREGWGRPQPVEELAIGVVEDDDGEEQTPPPVRPTVGGAPPAAAPGDDELEGRDWLR